jgi:hypothetical protein
MTLVIQLCPQAIGGWSRQRGLVMPVAEHPLRAALPVETCVDGLTLTRKHEFHLTLLDRSEAQRAAASISDQPLLDLIHGLDWEAQPDGLPWLIRDQRRDGGWRYSVIQLVELPALARFRNAIAAACAHSLPAMPAHITLYVAGDPAGIGLGSHTRFEALRQRQVHIG